MNIRNQRHRAPLSRLEQQMLLAIYGYPGCSGLELAELADVAVHVGYEVVSRLRAKGLVTSRRPGRFAEYTLTTSGICVAEAWMQFLRTLGPKLCQRLNLDPQ